MNTKHKQCETITEYLNLIVNEGYTYTIEDLSKILDMTEQYIQVNFINRLDTLCIDKENKLIIKKLMDLYQGFGDIHIPNDKTRELIVNTLNYKHKLKKKILISELSVQELLMDIFKKEIELVDHKEKTLFFIDRNKKTDKKLVPLTQEDIDIILNSELQLKSTKTLKEYLGVKYDAQLYRELKWRRYVKFVCEDNSKKNNRVRYLIY